MNHHAEFQNDLLSRLRGVGEKTKKFCFLWSYQDLSEGETSTARTRFTNKYITDVSRCQLEDEITHLKCVHSANFGDERLGPLQLLNQITTTGSPSMKYSTISVLL